MRIRTTVLLFVAVLAVALLTTPMSAQVLSGSVVGNITDGSGAAVPAATVTLLDRATGTSRESVSNDQGSFSFPTLAPATYELRVTKEGFRTAVEPSLSVTINTVTRADIALQLGAVAESISVSAASAMLQTDRSEVRSEMTATTFQNLPVPTGRNYQNLFRTLPGFRPPSNAHSVPTNPARALTFNVNGASQSINNTRIDGASSIAPWLPHATAFVPTLESIETVNVVTNSFDAEQGLAGGAAINVGIKSGTNAIHGSAFENYSSNALKAKNFFLPQGQDNPKLVVNEFGGSIGGPIVKDKLFYFGSYEANLNREFASTFATVPTPAMKRGDFSESPRGLYDPATGNGEGENRVPFPGKVVPLTRFSPITAKLIALTPNPTLGGLTNNFFAGGSYLFDRHRADSKITYTATPKLSIFGRFSILSYEMDNPQIFGDLGGPQLSGAGGNPGAGYGRTYSFTGAATYVFSPTFILDAYYGYTRMDTAVEQARLDEKLGSDFLGIPGTNGPREFEGGWPQFNIDSYTTLGVPNAFQPYYRRDPQYQYVVNFNKTKGSHEIRFGFDFYETHMNHLQPEAPGAFFGAQGGFQFSGGTTMLRVRNASGGLVAAESPNQFNSYASFVLGLPRTAGKITQVPDEYTTRSFQYSFYIRDRWNVSRKLTLSYGLRWEYFPFPTRADTGLEVYDTSTNKMKLCGRGSVPEDCGVTESKKKFAPRVGLAYRVNEGFVLRAGYGITNDPFSHARTFRTNYPILLIDNLQGSNDFVPYNPQGISAGIPAPKIPDEGNGIIDIPLTYAAFTIDDKFRRGYVQSWNFTVQKQLKWGFVGQAGYVATRSTASMGWLAYNAGQVIGAGSNGRTLYPQFRKTADVTKPVSFGTNMYDSLQATLERRFAQGMQVNIAYTFSKTMGYQDNNDSGPGVNAIAYWERNRTLRSYDRPHNLQISQIWELPFGKGKKWATDGVGAAVLGGWQVNNILSFFSGTPFTVNSDGSSLNLPGSTQTADQIKPSVAITGAVGRGTPYFDVDAFATVRDARFGNMAMNALRGPGFANWDFSVFRRFAITEKVRLEFRAEAFNFTNTPHFNNPGSNVSSYNASITNPATRYGGFGEILSTFNGVGRDGIDERQFRLGLRLAW